MSTCFQVDTTKINLKNICIHTVMHDKLHFKRTLLIKKLNLATNYLSESFSSITKSYPPLAPTSPPAAVIQAPGDKSAEGG